MLRIRTDQMKVFGQAAMQDFANRMLTHIQQSFPEHFESLGEDNCHELIRHGIDQAAYYGITSEIDVARYINLSVVLGPDFDSDERYPWIRQILKDPRIKPGQKVQKIFDLLKRARTEQKTRTSH